MQEGQDGLQALQLSEALLTLAVALCRRLLVTQAQGPLLFQLPAKGGHLSALRSLIFQLSLQKKIPFLQVHLLSFKASGSGLGLLHLLHCLAVNQRWGHSCGQTDQTEPLINVNNKDHQHTQRANSGANWDILHLIFCLCPTFSLCSRSHFICSPSLNLAHSIKVSFSLFSLSITWSIKKKITFFCQS